MSDDVDRAQVIEEAMRADALAEMAWRADGRAAQVSAMVCEDCDGAIPQERRDAYPGTQRCVECQTRVERQDAMFRGRR